ncbi:FAD-binding, type 2 [Cordyceps fumosorosea ARSEF 2679]|uniref:FAD-binding, type 2 n=1 Tax=Cordyceps fumosorosea (strain ARSEF 2679) TaxID=1081104 RepID=A0A167LYP6_CORFA|nr:FAD-binding, type 2 [Cordyceps fumosorosea ARSEF 2679]OAA53694.1 FAD-binding, type 2 [Cordyceps fumosorosea ARSEF 2679]
MKVSAAASVVLAAAASAAPGSRCCTDLAAQDSLRNKVFLPDSAVYDAQLKSYYSANAAQRAWCVVLPESTADVQAVARTITRRQCPFGVRAGGHSAWKGSNGVKDGITVDFSHMNATTFDPERRIAAIQPGARWGSVYETLHPHNVTVVGARTSVVGVGGFTTGSGYSFHTNEHGFSCDNVANWEIVLANGTVVNANAKENADLWKAQKGGSGNLGFVTRVDQVTIPGTQLWGGFTQYDLAKRDDVFKAYLNFVDNTKDGSPDQNIVALFWDNKDGFALRSILTNANGDANSTAFDEYMSLPNIGSTLTSGPEKDIIPQFTGPTPLGLYANWFTATAKHSFEALVAIDELHRALIPKLQAAAPDATFSTLISLQPLTPAMAAHAARQGGNVLGLDAVVADGPKINWLFSLTVDDPAHQEAMLPVAQEFMHTVNKKQRDMKTYEPWIFLNYAWRDQQPFTHYGARNRALLAAVSAVYDPRSVFQKLRKTGFKLDGRS